MTEKKWNNYTLIWLSIFLIQFLIFFYMSNLFKFNKYKPQNSSIWKSLKSDYTKTKSRPYKFTACVVVHNSAPYILEWIEFYKLQGVDHFVIYDDRSYDGVRLLPYLYEQNGYAGLIETFVPIFESADIDLENETQNSFEIRKARAFSHCLNTFNDKTKWFILVDDNQFVYSTSSKSLLNEIESPKWKDTASINIPEIIFGSNSIQKTFHNHLSINKDNGNFLVRFAPFYNFYGFKNSLRTPVDYPLVIEGNTKRIPLDPKETLIHPIPEICTNTSSEFYNFCNPSKGVHILRRGILSDHGDFDADLISFPIRQKVASHDEIISHRYILRSYQDLKKQIKTPEERTYIIENLDVPYFSAVYDDSLSKKYSNLILEAIKKLKPIPLENF